MIRFSNDRPWNFGVTPSEYFDEQAKHLHISGANVKDLIRFENERGFLRFLDLLEIKQNFYLFLQIWFQNQKHQRGLIV